MSILDRKKALARKIKPKSDSIDVTEKGKDMMSGIPSYLKRKKSK